MADMIPLQRPSRPPAEVVQARKAEVAKRYRKAAKRQRRHPLSLAAIRLSELTKLLDHRYGKMLIPETDDGLLAARVMVHHIGRLRDAPRRISAWLATCTPWMPMAERERLIAEVSATPLRWSADRLGWRLRLTSAERSTLRICTIAAIGSSPDERRAARAAKQRERDERRRRATGQVSRSEYLARCHQQTPWEAAGVSRSTWYRRLAQT